MKTHCKHENADHLKPGEFWENPADTVIAPYVAHCEQLRCLDCGAWLSLGPANDTVCAYSVLIEIRAAELAACLMDAKDRLRSNRRDTCGCFDRKQTLLPDDEAAARWLSDIIHDREPQWDAAEVQP